MRKENTVTRAMLLRRVSVGVLGVAGLLGPDLARAAEPDNQVSEVIVTVSRREEALQDVPIAVTALSGEQVKEARIQNFSDIPAFVPGAVFATPKGQSTVTIAIRGQVATNDSPHLDIPVAVFMDDVYYGTMASFSADFFDLDQIAILRGPQGTTFGRNVVGGALQITSRKPEFKNSGEVTVGMSKFATSDDAGFETNGFVNHQISDSLAGRLAYSLKDIGGHSRNLYTGTFLSNQKSYAVRPSLLWRPTDKLDVLVTGYHFHENQLPSAYQVVGQGALVASMVAQRSNPWDVNEDVDGSYKRDIYVGQIRADWDTGLGNLTLITSYRTLKSNYVDDGDSGPLPANSRSQNLSKEFQFSQEIRFASPDDRRFSYVVGGYYSFENLYKKITFTFNGAIPGLRLATLTGGRVQVQDAIGDSHVKSLAAFAEGKYRITDQLSLTLGGRYTIEDKEGYTAHVGASAFYGLPFDVKVSDRWSDFTPRAILDFKPTDDTMFYASVATGFKGGGWSISSNTALAAQTPLLPEHSTSYEVGAKLQLFDRRLRLDVAAYRADTKDLQIRSLSPVGAFTDTNAGALRVKGVEVEAVATVRGLTLGVNYAYTDAYFSKFKNCTATGRDCTGNQAPFAPKHDLTVSAQYEWMLANQGTVTAKIDGKWASDFMVSSLNVQPIVENLTGKKGFINASLIYESPDDLWKVQLWAKNLTNEWAYGWASNYNFFFVTQAEFAAGLQEVDRGVLTPPRQVGVTVTRRFH